MKEVVLFSNVPETMLPKLLESVRKLDSRDIRSERDGNGTFKIVADRGREASGYAGGAGWPNR